MVKNSWLILSAILTFGVFTVKSSLAEEVYFSHNENMLRAELILPESEWQVRALVVFVHGDGALTHNAYDYYPLIWDQLLANGYAVMSWDKPGVGDSQGQWLEQTMADRASEVKTAIAFAKQKPELMDKKVVVLGFSQAGWVLPQLADSQEHIQYMVGVGFARNWIAQGEYYTKRSLQLKGETIKTINDKVQDYYEEIAMFETHPSLEAYQQAYPNEKIEAERFGFVIKNFSSDATQAYQKIAVPSLLIWGRQDNNVDAIKEYTYWKKQNHPHVDILLLDNASHGLLKADKFNAQKPGLTDWLKMVWLGEDALTPLFVPSLLTWLDNQKL